MPRVSIAVLLVAVTACGGASEGDAPGAESEGVTPAPSPIVEADVGFYQDLAWSPDGSTLVLSVLALEGEEDYSYRVYELALGPARFSVLTPGPRDMWPSWSPDGARLAIGAERQGNRDIYTVRADGTDWIRLTTDPADDIHPDWSPDGSSIVFISERDGEPEVYVMDADGSNPVRIGDSPGQPWNPRWSPDALRITFYETDAEGNDAIFTMNADGTDRRRLADGVWPSWTPDGTGILYTAADGLRVIGLIVEESRLLLPGEINFGRFSPDGSRLGMIETDSSSVTVYTARTDGSGRRALLRRPKPDW